MNENSKIKDTHPEELRVLIDRLENARQTGIYFDEKAFSLEWELRSMEKDVVVSKEQAYRIKDEHLYGRTWRNA